MSISDNNLDHLFSQARTEEPVASLDETKKAFVTATIATVGGMLASKGLLKLLTIKKWIIMFSAISVVTTGSLIIGLTSIETPMDKALVPTPIVTQEEMVFVPEKIKDNETLNTINYWEDTEEKIPLIEAPLINETEEPSVFQIIQPPFKPQESALTIPPLGAKTIVQSDAEIIAYAKRFDITEKTTDAEFEALKKAAEKSGIDFFFKTKRKKGNLTKLRLELKLKEKEKESQVVMSTINIQGEFEYTIAWTEEEDGDAEHLYCGHTSDFDDLSDETTINTGEPDFIMNSLAMSNLFILLDSLDDVLEENLEFDMVALKEELKQHEKDIEKAIEEIDWQSLEKALEEQDENLEVLIDNWSMDDFEIFIEEISESSEELMRVIKIELEDMKIQINDTKKDKEKEKDREIQKVEQIEEGDEIEELDSFEELEEIDGLDDSEEKKQEEIPSKEDSPTYPMDVKKMK